MKKRNFTQIFRPDFVIGNWNQMDKWKGLQSTSTSTSIVPSSKIKTKSQKKMYIKSIIKRNVKLFVIGNRLNRLNRSYEISPLASWKANFFFKSKFKKPVVKLLHSIIALVTSNFLKQMRIENSIKLNLKQPQFIWERSDVMIKKIGTDCDGNFRKRLIKEDEFKRKNTDFNLQNKVVYRGF